MKGYMSSLLTYGAITRFILEVLNDKKELYYLAAPAHDGIVDYPEFENLTLGMPALYYFKEQAEKCERRSELLFLTTVSRNFQNKDVLLVPVDDECFLKGVRNVLSTKVTFIPWEQKKNVLFWRGAGSGYPRPNVRMRTVVSLIDVPNTDVKFIKWHTPLLESGPLLDLKKEKVYADHVPIQEFLNYKFILIIDGTCISSSIQWTFASGSVPVLITHPGNNWWFKKYIEPMVHYVPVAYDLSDLELKIQWLVENDDKAREIAENAVKFSETFLSSEFQHKYILDSLVSKSEQ
jgi:hypothetical protein